MKKLMIIAAVVMAVVSAKAASVDWKVTGTSSQVGYTVYLLASAPGTYASVAELAADAVGTGTIASMGRNNYYAAGTAASTAITTTSMAEAYFVIVTSSDATEYTYVSQDMSARVYDPANQESSKGTFGTTSATILAGTTAQFSSSPVPEPTSGLLMLLGMAGLALRRRRA